MKWAKFIEMFTATVDSLDMLTAIEKFTYLKGQLEEPTADCIQYYLTSKNLTSKNYEEAKKLLEERFSNPKVILSAHMSVLLKLPKLNNHSVSRFNFLL